MHGLLGLRETARLGEKGYTEDACLNIDLMSLHKVDELKLRIYCMQASLALQTALGTSDSFV